MAYERKDNSGAIFQNTKRRTDKDPTGQGDALIDGVEYWISAWTNKTNDGKAYYAVKFKRKDTPAPPPDNAAPPDDDENLPF